MIIGAVVSTTLTVLVTGVLVLPETSCAVYAVSYTHLTLPTNREV